MCRAVAALYIKATIVGVGFAVSPGQKIGVVCLTIITGMLLVFVALYVIGSQSVMPAPARDVDEKRFMDSGGARVAVVNSSPGIRVTRRP